MSDDTPADAEAMLEQVVSIVSAYVSHNSLRASDLPDLIGAVHHSLQHLAKPAVPEGVQPTAAPAVPIKKSLHREYIICLEDGKRFKSLRRHLNSFHQLSPDEYRAKWSLPSDYPMVAPAYSATRSRLAKDSGLGQIARDSHDDSDVARPDTVDESKPKRGRPRKQVP